MDFNNDVHIMSVVKGDISTFTHETTNTIYKITDYDVNYTVKGIKFTIPMQITVKNGKSDSYIMIAYLDDAMEKYYGKTLKEMGNGKKRTENRNNLAKKILTLALKKIGG